MKGSPAEQPQAQPLLWFQRPISNWRTRKRNSEAVPEIAAAASKKKDVVREVIVADQVSVRWGPRAAFFVRHLVQDLPPDIRKKVLAMGIPQDTLDMHFDILTTVMRFKLCDGEGGERGTADARLPPQQARVQNQGRGGVSEPAPRGARDAAPGTDEGHVQFQSDACTSSDTRAHVRGEEELVPEHVGEEELTYVWMQVDRAA